MNKPLDLQRDPKEKRRDYQQNFNFERRKRQFDATQRGWSGTSWPGRHAGAPELPNGGLFLYWFSFLVDFYDQ